MLHWPLELNKSRMILLVALLFTALGAGVFRTPPILFMAAVLCGAPLVGSFVGRISARNLRLKRQFPAVGTVGDEVVARLTVSNVGPLPAFLIHSRSQLAPSRPMTLATRKGKPTAGQGLVIVGEAEHVEPVLLAGASAVWEEKWRLVRRGTHELASAGAGALDPLGLYSRLGARTPAQEILVLPRPLKIGRLGWNGGASAGTRPPLQAARVADAADFHGIRAHQPGEGLRRIHWKSTARTGQLHVIEWEEEIASDLTLLLDVQAAVHAGPAGNDSLEALVTMAASIAAFLLESGHRFGMMWWASTPLSKSHDVNVGQSNPSKGKRPAKNEESLHLCRFEARNLGGLETMLCGLAKLQPCYNKEATLAHLIEQGGGHIPVGQGALLITTDRADLEAALSRVMAPNSVRRNHDLQTLIIDAASFLPNKGDGKFATSVPVAPSKQPGDDGKFGGLETSSPSFRPGYSMGRSGGTSQRRFRSGDSIVSVLEKGDGR